MEIHLSIYPHVSTSVYPYPLFSPSPSIPVHLYAFINDLLVVPRIYLSFFSLARLPLTPLSRPGPALPRDNLSGTSAGATAFLRSGTVGFHFGGGVRLHR